MRNNQFNALTGAVTGSITGPTLDAGQWYGASFLAYFSATCAGTFYLQASNDSPPSGYNALVANSKWSPTNWISIPSQTAAVTGGGSALLTVSPCTYRWVRAQWTTGTGTGTINVQANVQSV